MYEINETHDPNLKSWVESANDPNTDFPIQNLPFFYNDRYTATGLGTRIGDQILDLSRCFEDGLFQGEDFGDIGWKLGMSGFNFFQADAEDLSKFRRRLIEILS